MAPARQAAVFDCRFLAAPCSPPLYSSSPPMFSLVSRIAFALTKTWLGRLWRRALTADENRSWAEIHSCLEQSSALYSFRLFNLVTMAAGPHPFPSRTRSLSPPAPMVLHLLWESRSSPGFFKPQDLEIEHLALLLLQNLGFFY